MQKEKPDNIILLSTILPIAMKLFAQGIAVIIVAFLMVDIAMRNWEKKELFYLGFTLSLILGQGLLLVDMRDLIKEFKGKFSYVKAKLGF